MAEIIIPSQEAVAGGRRSAGSPVSAESWDEGSLAARHDHTKDEDSLGVLVHIVTVKIPIPAEAAPRIWSSGYDCSLWPNQPVFDSRYPHFCDFFLSHLQKGCSANASSIAAVDDKNRGLNTLFVRVLSLE